MEQEKDDIFRKLIREAGTESPSPDFTGMVMAVVQTENQESLILNGKLKAVLQENNVVQKPGHDFMLRVMSQVEVQQIARPPVLVVKPIISSRVWYMIAAACVAMICLTGVFYYDQISMPETVTTKPLTDKFFTSVASGMLAMPSVYSISLIALGALLAVDYMLRGRLTSKELI